MKKSDMEKNQLTDSQVTTSSEETTEIAVVDKKEKKIAKTKKVSKKNTAKIPKKKLLKYVPKQIALLR